MLPADGGRLHDLIVAEVGDDRHHADQREVHVADGLPWFVQHQPGGQRRPPQIGQQAGQGALVQTGQNGVVARGAGVGCHGGSSDAQVGGAR
jgi:hypothetical protein